MAANSRAVGKAQITKDMMITAIDDAISIVALKERDGVLPSDHVKRYIKGRIDMARSELDMLEKSLMEDA